MDGTKLDLAGDLTKLNLAGDLILFVVVPSILVVGLVGALQLVAAHRHRRKFEYATAVFMLVAGVSQLLAGVLAATYVVPTVATNTFWSPGILFWGLLTASGLYWLRGAAPLVYGFLEVAAAVAALSIAAFQVQADAYQRALPLLTGVYFLIRGMDNIERGLSDHWKRRWERVFPKRLPSPALETAPPPSPASR